MHLLPCNAIPFPQLCTSVQKNFYDEFDTDGIDPPRVALALAGDRIDAVQDILAADPRTALKRCNFLAVKGRFN